MSKIENPVVLVNVHKNHENSVAVHVTNGSNDYRDVRKGCIADLDEVHPDDAMERLPLEVLYYTAMALEEERAKNKKLQQIIGQAQQFIETIMFHVDDDHHGQHIVHLVKQAVYWLELGGEANDNT
ncbi:TPA: hypothetical protein RG734_002070 [Providencia stuartii]|uniref:hypothetical protein n=1 Tax=Providencia manganoxydans TaxID=2923283 RepID=UPI00294090F6|nr:hypothetical protein [Providencia stuartii]ELR5081572.1 hypothetical protein [Providencia stuartii]HEF8773056.1 hypothetical protein [Providencia stuartii]